MTSIIHADSRLYAAYVMNTALIPHGSNTNHMLWLSGFSARYDAENIPNSAPDASAKKRLLLVL